MSALQQHDVIAYMAHAGDVMADDDDGSSRIGMGAHARIQIVTTDDIEISIGFV